MWKSTEIVAELLIIGLLFLAIVILFIYGGLPPIPGSGEAEKFALSVLVIAGAYAIGIIFDKWADTLLQNLAQHQRLRFAVKTLTYGDLENLEKSGTKKDDPFPEQQIRLKILKHGKEVADYHDYLRTRMRITRAISCLLPALFMALLLSHLKAGELARILAGTVTGLIYIVLLVYIPNTKKQLPKTYDFEELKKYVDDRMENAEDTTKIELIEQDLERPLAYSLGALTLFGCGIVGYYMWANSKSILFILYPFGGLIITVLVGLAWWRISKTFLGLVLDCKQYGKLGTRVDQ